MQEKIKKKKIEKNIQLFFINHQMRRENRSRIRTCLYCTLPGLFIILLASYLLGYFEMEESADTMLPPVGIKPVDGRTFVIKGDSFLKDGKQFQIASGF